MARPALPARLLLPALLLPALLLSVAACATPAPAPRASLPPALPAATASAGPVLAQEWAAFLTAARPGDARRLPGPGGEPVTVTAGSLYRAASGRECRRYRVAAPPAPVQRIACGSESGWRAVRPVVSTTVEG